MTAKATKTTKPPTRLDDESELRRWTPQEVVDKRLLPYTSVRVLKQKCYRRQVFHHNDGGRISFTPADIRRENERTAVIPAAA
ncbi:hypothetical protein OG369_10090 [Streptomyces sp. NBC_01221]|uniref:hypothetical protein n=1 Tax=Streptomyces sp. NBC_01221 TaxID=2903782 RepID=UPI002258B5EB|nr:hypothetical protein [Streptomyces sp. NBC_01221]MCX4786522.1 hypothetical protein [Streptomyces sp. NBC_01221]